MKRKAVSCLLVLAAIMTMTPTIPTLAAENPDNTTQEATTVDSQAEQDSKRAAYREEQSRLAESKAAAAEAEGTATEAAK